MGAAAESMLAGWREKELIDISSEMTRLTYSIVGQTLFSFNPGKEAGTITFLLAGHETTANAPTWAFYPISQNPGVEDRLQQEFATVLGGRTPVPADIPQLKFTKAVIQEAMRLRLVPGHPVEPLPGITLRARHGMRMNLQPFDNPLLNGAKQGHYLAAGLALATGILAGCLIGRRKKA